MNADIECPSIHARAWQEDTALYDRSSRVVPPFPISPNRDPSAIRLLLNIRKDMLGLWSKGAYEQLIYRPKTFGHRMLLVNDPAGIKHVTGSGASNYRRPVSVVRLLRPVMSNGVIVSEGTTWRKQRRILAPIFAPALLNKLISHFLAAANGVTNRILAGSSANLAQEMNNVALDGILRSLFSLPELKDRREFVELIHKYLRGPGRPHFLDIFARSESSFSCFFRARQNFASARETAIVDLVQGCCERDRKDELTSADLVDLLAHARDAETGAQLSIAEIAEQAATILFAGFETTSSHLFWTLYLLALDPDEQERVRDELRRFPPEQIMSVSDLENWPRLRLVMYESLRLYPPGPNLAREAISDDEICGEPVKKGDQVWVSPWVLHRHKRFWPMANEFRPERFVGQSTPWIGGAFVPFGAGPRTCIAATFALTEAQIILGTLLHRAKLDICTGKPVVPQAGVTLRPSYEPSFSIERVQ